MSCVMLDLNLGSRCGGHTRHLPKAVDVCAWRRFKVSMVTRRRRVVLPAQVALWSYAPAEGHRGPDPRVQVIVTVDSICECNDEGPVRNAWREDLQSRRARNREDCFEGGFCKWKVTSFLRFTHSIPIKFHSGKVHLANLLAHDSQNNVAKIAMAMGCRVSQDHMAIRVQATLDAGC